MSKGLIALIIVAIVLAACAAPRARSNSTNFIPVSIHSYNPSAECGENLLYWIYLPSRQLIAVCSYDLAAPDKLFPNYKRVF